MPLVIPPLPDFPPIDNRPLWRRLLITYLPWFLTLVGSAVITWLTSLPAQVVEKPVPPVFMGQEGERYIGTADGIRPTTGWVENHDVIAANLDPLVTTHFADTPAGKAVQGDEDVFLWQAVRKVNNKGPPWYPNIDQGQVGCCVGAGWKHATDICLAASILSGQRFEWKPVSAEVIYGNSRVAIGGHGHSPFRGDGSSGGWANEAVKTLGVAPMETVGGVDLSQFSSARARSYGNSGVPQSVEDVAKQYPVKGTALVRTAQDVERAIRQMYPVAVCSGQGFTMARDATGKCRPSGTWQHCMCICGVRTLNGQKQFFILNSWGDNAHTGPLVPSDALAAGFWADAAVVDRMVGEGDSFALADIVGFPARKVPVDWFVQARPPFQPLFAGVP